MTRRREGVATCSMAVLSLVLAACAPTAYARDTRSAAPQSQPKGIAPGVDAQSGAQDDAGLLRSTALVQPAESAPALTSEVSQPQIAVEVAAEPASEQNAAQQTPVPAAAEIAPTEAMEFFRIDRGANEVPLLIPRGESLVYEVHLNLGWIGSPTVGKVTMTSEVQPFYSDVPGQPEAQQALLKGRAEGSYQVYTLDNLISSALLPQDWPRSVHRNVQTGTESRQRESLLGVVKDQQVSRYRSDGHCKGCKEKAHFVEGTWPWQDSAHCKKCKKAEHRVWREAQVREVPPGTLDMLTAVFLARSLVIDGRDKVEFPLVDRTDLWRVQLSRGRTKVIETTAGKFNAVEVQLRTSASAGAVGDESTEFEGLFGIHGTISIWMEASSGVPVRIDGSVPAGPINLDVTIELRSARGAPRVFTALR